MITESMVQDKLVEGHHINLRDIVVTGSIISETVDWYAYYDEYTCVKNTECVNLCGFAEIPKYILKKTNSTGNEWQCMEYDIPLVGERRLGTGDSIFPPPISEEFPIGSLPGDPDPGEFKKRCPAGTRCTPPGVCIDALRETMGDTTELFPSVWDYYDWR